MVGTDSVQVRPALAADAAAIAAIYNRHVLESIVTFEEVAVAELAMRGRIEAGGGQFPWFVAVVDDKVVGYAYAGPWKTRTAYRFVAETSVYVAEHWQGRGVGARVYGDLLAELRARGFAAAVGCIALPNPASVALHETLGFKPVGVFPAVGWKFGRWIDVGYWQVSLGESPPGPVPAVLEGG